MITRNPSHFLAAVICAFIAMSITEISAFSTPCDRIKSRCHSPFPISKATFPRMSNNEVASNHHSNADQVKLSMCICIDCARVNSCVAYHFIERKHEQPHMTDSPTFEPRDGSPTIHVNIRTIRSDKDRDDEIKRMFSVQKKVEEEEGGAGVILGDNQVYDATPVTTYEYDVVECADFVKDKGCWVRNMPEEIRTANPDFVPS